MSACAVMTAIPWFPRRSLTAFGHLITLTIETADGNEYHRAPPLKRERS
jgi:hypothetical protein